MQAYQLKLVRATDDKSASKMLSSFQIPAFLPESLFEGYVPLLQLDIEALPEHPFPMKDGLIQFFVKDEYSEEVLIVVVPKTIETKTLKHASPGFDILIGPDEKREGMRMFGKPYELNLEVHPDHIMLLQYDPYESDELDFLQTVDGFFYVMISKEDLEAGKFENAYTILDRT